MSVNKFFKKTMMGTAALAMVVALAGCGKQSAAESDSSSSSTTTSVRSSASKATKAYRKANQLIKNGQYEDAYNQLSSLNEHNAQTEALMDDLQSYLDAKNSYSSGDYDSASNSLKSQKSQSSAMKSAFSSLKGKINAKKGSSTVASSTSTQTSKKSSSQSSVANQAASDATSDDVVNQFATKMGFTGNKGYQIIPTQTNGNLYQFEVRQNNSDNTVANLVGIYQYNSQTGTATKIN